MPHWEHNLQCGFSAGKLKWAELSVIECMWVTNGT